MGFLGAKTQYDFLVWLQDTIIMIVSTSFVEEKLVALLHQSMLGKVIHWFNTCYLTVCSVKHQNKCHRKALKIVKWGQYPLTIGELNVHKWQKHSECHQNYRLKRYIMWGYRPLISHFLLNLLHHEDTLALCRCSLKNKQVAFDLGLKDGMIHARHDKESNL